IVGLMTQLARIAPGERVLEIGTGSGYQTAIVGLLAGEVFTIEIVEALARRAQDTLRRLGLAENVHFLEGDGASGWPPASPYAAILVTAAPREVPRALTAQLGVGGRLVIPVGVHEQQLLLIERSPTGLTERTIAPVRFVPLTGAATAIQ